MISNGANLKFYFFIFSAKAREKYNNFTAGEIVRNCSLFFISALRLINTGKEIKATEKNKARTL